MTTQAKYYFEILTSSGVPIFRQIMDQVKTHIATGTLQAGTFLPSVRQVAAEIEINPMTVSKAYSLLEKEGVLEFVRGQGMRVGASGRPKKNLESREEQLVPVLEEVITKSRQLSLGVEHVVELMKGLWRRKRNG